VPSIASLSAWGALLQGAGALATATVAVAAVYFSYRTTQNNIDAQQEQNRESLDVQERVSRSNIIWTRRMEAYEEALMWLSPILSSLAGERSDRSPVMAPDEFARGEALPPLLDAKLRLYASGPALIALATLREPLTLTRDVVDQLARLEAALRDHVDRSSERKQWAALS